MLYKSTSSDVTLMKATLVTKKWRPCLLTKYSLWDLWFNANFSVFFKNSIYGSWDCKTWISNFFLIWLFLWANNYHEPDNRYSQSNQKQNNIRIWCFCEELYKFSAQTRDYSIMGPQWKRDLAQGMRNWTKNLTSHA